MDKNVIDYKKLVDEAMHIIVRKTLAQVEKSGLPGNHHFYISFLTQFSGVKLSKYLLSKYPKEMTIILQHQFKDLKVSRNQFEVLLSFGGVMEYIVIPFSAITSFADPSVKFGLQFREILQGGKQKLYTEFSTESEKEEDNITKVKQEGGDTKDTTLTDNIVSLDKFRQKAKSKKQK